MTSGTTKIARLIWILQWLNIVRILTALCSLDTWIMNMMSIRFRLSLYPGYYRAWSVNFSEQEFLKACKMAINLASILNTLLCFNMHWKFPLSLKWYHFALMRRELPFAESINSFRARQWIENGWCNGFGVINRAIKLLKANRSMLGKKSDSRGNDGLLSSFHHISAFVEAASGSVSSK